jgi:hypothetical protein
MQARRTIEQEWGGVRTELPPRIEVVLPSSKARMAAFGGRWGIPCEQPSHQYQRP